MNKGKVAEMIAWSFEMKKNEDRTVHPDIEQILKDFKDIFMVKLQPPKDRGEHKH